LSSLGSIEAHVLPSLHAVDIALAALMRTAPPAPPPYLESFAEGAAQLAAATDHLLGPCPWSTGHMVADTVSATPAPSALPCATPGSGGEARCHSGTPDTPGGGDDEAIRRAWHDAHEPHHHHSPRLHDRGADAGFAPSTRVMVTMPTAAASDEGLVRRLVANGMSLVRINCAHGEAVSGMGKGGGGV